MHNPLHYEIIPAPGTFSSWEEIERRIQLVLPFAESIHIDINDGSFSETTTWMDPAPFAKYTKQAIFEVHLMTDNPLQYVREFADAGFQRFVGQIEKMPDIAEFLAECELYGDAGLAYDGPTSFEKLPVGIDDIDVVGFYTAEKAGKSLAVFDPEKLEKVKLLRSQNPFVLIEIDGGVNDTNISLAKEAGVTRFVTTGYLYNGNPEENYLKLKQLIAS